MQFLQQMLPLIFQHIAASSRTLEISLIEYCFIKAPLIRYVPILPYYTIRLLDICSIHYFRPWPRQMNSHFARVQHARALLIFLLPYNNSTK